jgi:PIN domain nuclease of toxin-antitoxin system
VILDAYAVLALLKGEPAAGPVSSLLAEDGGARLTAVGVAEVVDHLIRLVGTSEDEAALDVAQLGLADSVPVDASMAIAAGMLRARHYHRRHRAVSLADCVAAEAARIRGVELVSADPHLLDLCHDEGIDRIALPDTAGRVWST